MIMWLDLICHSHFTKLAPWHLFFYCNTVIFSKRRYSSWSNSQGVLSFYQESTLKTTILSYFLFWVCQIQTKLSWFSLLQFAGKNMSLLNNLYHHLFTGICTVADRLRLITEEDLVALLLCQHWWHAHGLLYIRPLAEGAGTFDHEPSRSSDVDWICTVAVKASLINLNAKC